MSLRTRLVRALPKSDAEMSHRTAKAVAAVTLSATAALGLAGCAEKPPQVADIACSNTSAAAELPKSVTLYQDGWKNGGSAPNFKIIAPQDGVNASWGVLSARSVHEFSNSSSAQNPCHVQYGNALEQRKFFFGDDETIELHGPSGVRFMLEKEYVKSLFDGHGRNEFVLNGPNGENLAISRKTESLGGSVSIRLQDPSTGATLGLVEKQSPTSNKWTVESMSEKAPTWLLIQLAGLKSSDDAREAAEDFDSFSNS